LKQLEAWLREVPRGRVNFHEAGITFYDPNDAMLCKLAWGGDNIRSKLGYKLNLGSLWYNYPTFAYGTKIVVING
jgi:hypothetical protein